MHRRALVCGVLALLAAPLALAEDDPPPVQVPEVRLLCDSGPNPDPLRKCSPAGPRPLDLQECALAREPDPADLKAWLVWGPSRCLS